MNSGLFDIHSHILPGVDDGASDMELSLQMAEEAYAQGVRTMIATPHFYPGHHNCSAKKLDELHAELSARIRERHEDFTLLLGNEIYYKEEIVGLLKEKQIHTLAGTRYILVEFSVTSDFKHLYDAVHRCVNAGYYPVVAHVERYHCFFGNEGKIAELIRAGAYIQVNAENFKKGWLRPERKRAIGLIRQGMVHFLGSDCHNMQSRKPDLGMAAEYLPTKAGQEVCKAILETNPLMLIQNKCI